jgi:hypothetical protein
MGMKTYVTAKLAISIVMVILAGEPVFAEKVIYVNANATGAGDGTNWENAYRHLQDALADANSSEKPVEIRVAQGVYTPDTKSAAPDGTGTREATFQLINGVTLMGGYAGYGAADPNARDVKEYETILSGDLDGNDVELEGAWLWWYSGEEPSRIDNSYHVVTGSYTDSSARLDGFTITSGVAEATGSEFENGGGMYNFEGGPTVINCAFVGNTAHHGAGMFNYDGTPTVTGCTFYRNWATVSTSGSGGGVKNFCYHWYVDEVPTFRDCIFIENCAVASGGGMHNDMSSSLTNCTFIRNESWDIGGGMSNSYCSPVVAKCTFRDDSATWGGGGMFNWHSSPTVTSSAFISNTTYDIGGGMLNMGGSPVVMNCVFSGNSTGTGPLSVGGGMVNSSSSATIANCTFVGNSSQLGMHNQGGGGIVNSGEGSAIVRNCILWGNAGPVGRQMSNACELRISYCTIEGGLYGSGVENVEGASVIDGGGNIDYDPCFADPGYWSHKDDPNLVVEPNDPNKLWVNGDYHLKSQAGRWDANEGRWTNDDVTSLCIDAGDLMSPIGLEPFPNGGVINMGAYGGTNEASKSYFDGPVCEIIVAGDINGDCAVNFLDFAIMALHWLDEH